ncbi:uncharacterized protein MAM_03054 [Metarhizium album ARSEF 1941]|uniref:Uncharacterized protein n=1 Tax=Metarhizium album (strain ARSEF 1941) TaxID=1081103 RepID=A0A0B2WTF7_METAS|nr:uncharacterized protein MAM_03054 [Metarhizium album ARSEF 1941]KHN99356.1 hypothetical protein MAM_03054 [Metarhizium album ARSEF 1941]
MDKGSLLAASRVEPVVSINPRSTVIGRLWPLLAFAARFQYIISSFSSFLYIQTCFVTSLAVVSALCASRFLTIRAYVATESGAVHAFNMSAKAFANLWDAKTTRVLRRNLFYEFAVFILGSGNSIILLLFWPGWLVVGGATFALWKFLG